MRYAWYEYVIILLPTLVGVFGGYLVVRKDWKRYGALYLLSGITATLLCWTFIMLQLYKFPNNPLHGRLLFPIMVLVTFLPFTVVAGVRFSPKRWVWKIPFYWVIVHLAIVSELLLLFHTKIIEFTVGWDLWDSYTLWWIYYLLFEALGGKIVPARLRNPLHPVLFRYGNWVWIVLHVILIATIFVFGMYTGKLIWG